MITNFRNYIFENHDDDPFNEENWGEDDPKQLRANNNDHWRNEIVNIDVLVGLTPKEINVDRNNQAGDTIGRWCKLSNVS